MALAFTVRGDLLPVPRSVRCRVYLPALRLQDCWRQLMASMAELERRDPVADEKWIRVHRSPDTLERDGRQHGANVRVAPFEPAR